MFEKKKIEFSYFQSADLYSDRILGKKRVSPEEFREWISFWLRIGETMHGFQRARSLDNGRSLRSPPPDTVMLTATALTAAPDYARWRYTCSKDV